MEEGVGLLPSPNWCALRRKLCAFRDVLTGSAPPPRYGAQLADWGAAGDAPLVAYAARNSVLLLRPLSQQVAGSLTGHTNRVTVRAAAAAGGRSSRHARADA